MLLRAPSHITSCAAPSFYLQTLTRPHSLPPKTLFWSNMTRISCTLFQQQTLLITCNMPGQQTFQRAKAEQYSCSVWYAHQTVSHEALYKWKTLSEIKIFHRNMPISDRQRQRVDSFPASQQPSVQVILQARWWEHDLLLTSPTLLCLQVSDKVNYQAVPELWFSRSPSPLPCWQSTPRCSSALLKGVWWYFSPFLLF